MIGEPAKHRGEGEELPRNLAFETVVSRPQRRSALPVTIRRSCSLCGTLISPAGDPDSVFEFASGVHVRQSADQNRSNERGGTIINLERR